MGNTLIRAGNQTPSRRVTWENSPNRQSGRPQEPMIIGSSGWGVGVGGVEEVDPALGGPVQDGDRRSLIALQAEGHRPQAQPGDLQAGPAESGVLHDRTLPARQGMSVARGQTRTMKWSAGGVVPPGYWSGGWCGPRQCRRAGGTGITSGSATAAPGTEFAAVTGEWTTAASASGVAQASSSSRSATVNARWSRPARVSSNASWLPCRCRVSLAPTSRTVSPKWWIPLIIPLLTVSSPGQPVAGGSCAAPGAWNPRARLPLDHLIKMSHDTRRAARRIMGDLRPGRMVGRPAGCAHWCRSCPHYSRHERAGDEPRWVA